MEHGGNGVYLSDRARPAPASARTRKGTKIRVLVVDDHKAVREGLAGLLQSEPDIEVVGEAADGPQAIALAAELAPDVITMDVTMPGMSGIEATRIIVSRMPQAKVIGLSMHVDDSIATAMRKSGAVGYLTKDGPPEALLEAIRTCRSE